MINKKLVPNVIEIDILLEITFMVHYVVLLS